MEEHTPLPVVECVQVCDTEVAVRHCCYSLPSIPLPGDFSSRKQPLKKKWAVVSADVAFN